MGTMATSNFTPDDETAALFARYRRAKETEETLRPAVKARAVEVMSEEDATVSELAKLTGMTDEVFRRLARENKVARRREPTVGKDAKPKGATTAPVSQQSRREPESPTLPALGSEYAPVAADIAKLARADVEKFAKAIKKREGAQWVAAVLDQYPGEDAALQPYRIVEHARDAQLISDRELYPQEP